MTSCHPGLNPGPPNIESKPTWLRVRAPSGDRYEQLKDLIKKERLHTVCSSASCPNIGECWNIGTATFMIMGNICTRACRFCHVKTARPGPLDLDEPKRLADTVERMVLDHVVITSVTRDDLPDGGAKHIRKCLDTIHQRLPNITLEVLTPDFSGRPMDVKLVATSHIRVFNHNIETVRRLTRKIRSGGQYDRSLSILKLAKAFNPNLKTKTGLMLGLGETLDEVKEALCDARDHEIDTFTIGQYLRPTLKHHPVMRYAKPEEFLELKTFALQLGFSHVESGPLVRSSYHAEQGV